jgi:predicted amidophosphoribosyltransferase
MSEERSVPRIVCCGCGSSTAINKPICDACIGELVRTRTHIPYECCWCVPTVNYEDPDTGRRVLVHNEVH